MRASRLALAALLPLAAGCGKPSAPLEEWHRLETFNFDPASSVESRVTAMPQCVLDFMREFDERPDYEAYSPAPRERELVAEYLRLLPPVYERVFGERCAGIYFIPGMSGNGLADWVIGPGGKAYFYLVLNPAVMKTTLSGTLSGRDRSCFSSAPGWSLNVAAGGKYSGLFYALAHEGAHGLDYALGISPYADGGMPERYRPGKPALGVFFREMWADYSVPAAGREFTGRDKVTFYGFGGGPRLKLSEAPAVYRGMNGSGFVSLYASMTWGEELAELATFGALIRQGQACSLEVKGPGQAARIDPLSGPAGSRVKTVMEYLEGLK